MASTRDAIDASVKNGEQAFLDHFEAHLLDKSAEACLGECPLIAMGSELARADKETRHAATRGYRELIKTMAANGASDEGAAMFVFSAILGAVTVSRIVDDPDLAARILAEAKQRIATLWSNACERDTTVQQGIAELENH
jgi:TetR/AcrR family transcriptional regulator, transcriptional repressor for nem operon